MEKTIEQVVNDAIRSTEGDATTELKAAAKAIEESDYPQDEKWKAWQALSEWYQRKRQKEIERGLKHDTVHQGEVGGALQGVETEAPTQTQATHEEADRATQSATPTEEQPALAAEGQQMDRRGMADRRSASLPQAQNPTQDNPQPQVQDEGNETQGGMGESPQGKDP